MMLVGPCQNLLNRKRGQRSRIPPSTVLGQELRQRGTSGQTAVAAFQGLVNRKPSDSLPFDPPRPSAGPLASPLVMLVGPGQNLING
jgi:hypothetical protein